MGRKISCHCEAPSLEDIISGGGDVLGQFCRRCMRPMGLACPVCKTKFRDVTAHLKTSACKEHAKKRRFWGSNYYEEEQRAAGTSTQGDSSPATEPGQRQIAGADDGDEFF